MKVFLDDVRKAPKGWASVTNARRVIQLLETREVDEISLDHDLGPEQVHGTGMDVIMWLEGAIENGFRPIPKIHVHSMNAVARQRMIQIIDRIEAIHYPS